MTKNTENQTAEEKVSARERNANFLSSIAEDIRTANAKALENAKESILAYVRIGELLNDAKDTLQDERGAFGKWVEEMGFTFNKTWRARLMKLAANWSEIEPILAAHEDPNKVWSVDAALAAWNAKKKEEEKAANGGAGEGEGEGSEGGDTEEKPKKASKKDLEEEVERLKARIAELESENGALAEAIKAMQGGPKGDGPKGGSKGSKAKSEETNAKGSANDDKKPVDGQTKARAKKVWGLYTRGGTEGEKASAKARLEEMAGRFNMNFDEFVKTCGVAA